MTQRWLCEMPVRLPQTEAHRVVVFFAKQKCLDIRRRLPRQDHQPSGRWLSAIDAMKATQLKAAIKNAALAARVGARLSA